MICFFRNPCEPLHDKKFYRVIPSVSTAITRPVISSMSAASLPLLHSTAAPKIAQLIMSAIVSAGTPPGRPVDLSLPSLDKADALKLYELTKHLLG